MTAADEGMLRIYPNDVARGAKLFSPGFSDMLDPKLWTDDGSSYVELHGGVMPTFNDWYELEPGGEITWSEIWYPVAGIGAVTQATGTPRWPCIATAILCGSASSPQPRCKGR